MNSIFGRALIGFVILTACLCAFSYMALWAMTAYAPTLWWGHLFIILISLVIEVGVFGSTLYEPIYDWIKEPKKKAEGG